VFFSPAYSRGEARQCHDLSKEKPALPGQLLGRRCFTQLERKEAQIGEVTMASTGMQRSMRRAKAIFKRK
jgi:hypothetical protein